MLFMTVRIVHILAAIWFCCGFVGYLVARLAMLRTEDVRGVDALVKLMGRFRDFLIRPGSALLVIFGIWTAYYEGWPEFSIHALILLIILIPFVALEIRGGHKVEAATAEAVKSGSVTPELKAAMHARPLVIGDYGVAIIVILFLFMMLVK